MSEFEEALKRSVLGLGEAYLAAEKDLHDETAAASESVNRITQGTAQLVLKKEGESAEGTDFGLYLAAEKRVPEIAAFRISPKGYPIKVFPYVPTFPREDVCEAVLGSRPDIRAYFNDMASSPDSRLVLRIAFLLRKSAEARKQPA